MPRPVQGVYVRHDGGRMRKRLIMGVLAALAIGGIVFTFSGPRRTVAGRPAAVENVTPSGGDLDLRQVTLSADLAPGYEGYLILDRIEVPQDDVQWVLALNTLTLKPQPGSDYARLSPGRHCASVVYYPIGGNRSSNTGSYTWCFQLH